MTKDINQLKLIGKNIEDLKTISAYCQDSIVKIKDLVYLKKNKIFIMMLGRFMWDDIEKGVFRNYKRIKSVLKFNFIENVLAKNINQQQKNRNLELLAIKSNYNQNNLYNINLIFSGNGIVLLKSEETDVMLDMGFVEDIQFILDLTPEERVTSLWSATMPQEIMRLAQTNMNSPKKILVDSDDLSGAGIDQSFLIIKDREKPKFVLDFIDGNIGQCIVFCSTKIRTRDVARMLRKAGKKSVAIEGDMSQNKREDSMQRFRKAKADILVATDVAARGIDVPEVALVINYDIPNQDMVYFHRIGRTARAGAKGRAITLVSYSSVGEWNEIKKQTKVKMTDLNQKLGIEFKIPDPLKRRADTGRRFNRFAKNTGRQSHGRHRNARDQYDKRKSPQHITTRSYFSKKKRW